jgi:hypothetical protein
MFQEQSDPSGDSVPANPVEFTTAHWSVVLKAGETESAEATAALEWLCRTSLPSLKRSVAFATDPPLCATAGS